MPPKPLFNPAILNFEHTVFDKDAIRARLPHRYEMEMLDRVIYFDAESQTIAGIKEVRDDEFWVRGHFPGRPVLPGVLIGEAAGQLSALYYSEVTSSHKILGFAAADSLKFRGTVVPGDDLLILGSMLEIKPRIARFQAQGLVDRRIVFEGIIVSMAL